MPPRMQRALGAVLLGLLLAGCHMAPVRPGKSPAALSPPLLRYEAVEWAALPGFGADDLSQAWPALLASCGAPRMPQAWREFCRAATQVASRDVPAQRTLLTTRLRAYRVVTETREKQHETQDTGMITGVLRARAQRLAQARRGVPDAFICSAGRSGQRGTGRSVSGIEGRAHSRAIAGKARHAVPGPCATG